MGWLNVGPCYKSKSVTDVSDEAGVVAPRAAGGDEIGNDMHSPSTAAFSDKIIKNIQNVQVSVSPI